MRWYATYRRIACCMALGLSLAAQSANAEPNLCTYDTWVWDTHAMKSVSHTRVSKKSSDLQAEEMDPATGCSVCEQDQADVKVEGIPVFRICKTFRDRIAQGLAAVIASGWQVKSISGYRVGKTRGPIDPNGHRTAFSNHSFGTAIDFNSDHNGLYIDCTHFNSTCRLTRGGKWNPQHPYAITPNTPIYKMFQAMGWKWGGEIAGNQKDFMHFSLTGY